MIFAVSAHEFFDDMDKRNGQDADGSRRFRRKQLFCQRKQPARKHRCRDADALRAAIRRVALQRRVKHRVRLIGGLP